jgi:hypothetical protein
VAQVTVRSRVAVAIALEHSLEPLREGLWCEIAERFSIRFAFLLRVGSGLLMPLQTQSIRFQHFGQLSVHGRLILPAIGPEGEAP